MFLQSDEDVWRVAVGYDDLDASLCHLLRCVSLRGHAATAVAALAGLDILADVSVVVNRRYDASVRVARVAVVDAIHIGEEDEGEIGRAHV